MGNLHQCKFAHQPTNLLIFLLPYLREPPVKTNAKFSIISVVTLHHPSFDWAFVYFDNDMVEFTTAQIPELVHAFWVNKGYI
jgi:hypothetical protein